MARRIYPGLANEKVQEWLKIFWTQRSTEYMSTSIPVRDLLDTSRSLSSISYVISSRIEVFTRDFELFRHSSYYMYDFGETTPSIHCSKAKLFEKRLDGLCKNILKMLQILSARELETSSVLDPSRDSLANDRKLLIKLFGLASEIFAIIPQISFIFWKLFMSCPWRANGDEPAVVVVHAVVVSTLSLLSIVYQYLLGNILEGGTAAYSSGTLDFREIFVSLLLFQGSYVWIFFREVAPRNVYRRSKKDEAGRVVYFGKFEPRFKPPREKLPGGTTMKFDHLPLGGYDNEHDAKLVCQIAGYLYVKDEGRIELRDGSFFTIPAVPEQEQRLCGKERARWVAARAKEIFRDYQVKNNAIILPSESNEVGAPDFLNQHVVSEAFSMDALWDAADTVDSEFVYSLCAVGEGWEGTVSSPSSTDLSFVDSLIAGGESSDGTPAAPSMAEQVVLTMERPQSLDLVSLDAGSVGELEISFQELKEQLEAERYQRISEHEQHLERQKQLEERISQLEREKEERNSKLQVEYEFVESLLSGAAPCVPASAEF